MRQMRKPSTKIVSGITIICLAFLAASLLGIGPSATAGNMSFTTPEDAITFYMQAAVQGDIDKIMQACAINEMAENFRFDLYTDRLRALMVYSPAPSDYPFYAEMNKAQFSWQILSQTKNLAYGLLATEKGIVEGMTVIIDTEETSQFIEQFIAEVDPERLAQLQVMEIGVPNPEIAHAERNLENWNRQAQIYGADELTERVVLFLFEGDYYYIGFTLLRYGEDWKISSAASPLGNTPALGAPQETTAEEFQELIGSN